MRRMFTVAVILFVAGVTGVGAAGEIAALRAELAKQQEVIAQLLERLERSGKQQPPPADDSRGRGARRSIKAQEDSINSLREIVNSRVNLNGDYNFRFVDGRIRHRRFQQHHLGVLLAKQLGKFNFLMELELQNVPHHPVITPERRIEQTKRRRMKKRAWMISAAKARWLLKTRGRNTIIPAS